MPDPLPFKEQTFKEKQQGSGADVSSHVHNFSISFLTALARPVLPAGYWQANARAGDDNKTLNLTYDDGPNPATTGQLLKLLKKKESRLPSFLLAKTYKDIRNWSKKSSKAATPLAITA